MDACREKVCVFVSEILEVDRQTVTGELSIGDIPQWDSLAQAKIVVGIEERFGIALEIDQILDIESVEDIVKIVCHKG